MPPKSPATKPPITERAGDARSRIVPTLIPSLTLARPTTTTVRPSSRGKRVWMVSRYSKQRLAVAEALAGQSGFEMKRIDLSTVVSRYIGETEKNLARIFAEAEGKDWLLFFDEADALFGKRSDVKDSHDRYANQEVSFFLDQLQQSTSSVIVAMRRKHNIDPAFLRRLRISTMTSLPLPPVRLKKMRRRK